MSADTGVYAESVWIDVCNVCSAYVGTIDYFYFMSHADYNLHDIHQKKSQ